VLLQRVFSLLIKQRSLTKFILGNKKCLKQQETQMAEFK